MKNMILAALAVTSLNAYAADFYECNSFSGVDENRVGIDMNLGMAAFFDNDATSYMKLVETRILEIYPPQILNFYEGFYEGNFGELKLSFNLTTGRAHLWTRTPEGELASFGRVKCEKSDDPWDFSDALKL